MGTVLAMFFRCFVCNIPAYAAPPPSFFQYFSIVRFLVSVGVKHIRGQRYASIFQQRTYIGVNNNCRCPCRTILPKRFLFFVHFLFTLYMMYWIRMTNNNTIASETTRMSNKSTIIIDFHPFLVRRRCILDKPL